MKNKIIKKKLKIISSPAGNIIKYLTKKDKHFIRFGEIYFNQIKKGYVKGWNLHKECTCLITVIFGSIEFVITDYNKKNRKKYILKDNKPSILIIPPKKWFKFRSLQNKSTICNLIDRIHDKNETKKIPILS